MPGASTDSTTTLSSHARYHFSDHPASATKGRTDRARSAPTGYGRLRSSRCPSDLRPSRSAPPAAFTKSARTRDCKPAYAAAISASPWAAAATACRSRPIRAFSDPANRAKPTKAARGSDSSRAAARQRPHLLLPPVRPTAAQDRRPCNQRRIRGSAVRAEPWGAASGRRADRGEDGGLRQCCLVGQRTLSRSWSQRSVSHSGVSGASLHLFAGPDDGLMTQMRGLKVCSNRSELRRYTKPESAIGSRRMGDRRGTTLGRFKG